MLTLNQELKILEEILGGIALSKNTVSNETVKYLAGKSTNFTEQEISEIFEEMSDDVFSGKLTGPKYGDAMGPQ